MIGAVEAYEFLIVFNGSMGQGQENQKARHLDRPPLSPIK